MAIILLSLLVAAVLLNYGVFGERWRGIVGRALRPALLLGGIGFAGGFFGPIVFAPDANQGPLLGIFITGPLGFVLGLGWGSSGRRWGAGPLEDSHQIFASSEVASVTSDASAHPYPSGCRIATSPLSDRR